MSEFSWEHHLPQPASTVFQWYSRPGAFTRLVPDFMATAVREPDLGLRVTSRSVLALSPDFLPTRKGLKWVARHTQYQCSQDGGSFTDVQEQGPMKSWTHRHVIEPTATGSGKVLDDLQYELPRPAQSLAPAHRYMQAQLERMFAFRSRRTSDDLRFHVRYSREKKTFLISGASGLIGSQLVAFLRSGGHEVLTLRRSGSAQADERSWDPEGHGLMPEALAGVDVVVHLAGEPIGGRFTQEHRRKVLESRTKGTRAIYEAMKQRQKMGHEIPQALICASASGFYGHDAGTVSEESPQGEDFLAKVCGEWEGEAAKFEELGVRRVSVRTGLVMSSQGGLLALQLPLYYAGLGGILGNGKMWQSWIAADDLVRIYAFASLQPQVHGPINAAAPNPVRQKDFACSLGDVLNRPTLFPTPSLAPALLLGRQGAEELALSSIQMNAQKILDAGFDFAFEDLTQALRHTLGR